MEEYLQAHLEELTLPAQRQVKYVLVDRNLLRDRVEIPEEELKAYYDDHASEFSTDEQVRARHILLRTGGERSVDEAKQEIAALRARIEGGEDFAEVARETSEDPGSAQRGGDLDWFGRGAMVPAFEDAAFNAQVGELVGPVESPFGVHLLQVTDKREAGQRPFDEVKDQVRFQLAQDRVADLAREKAAEIASQLQGLAGDARVEAMRAAAEGDAAVFFYEPPAFAQGDPVAGVGRAPAFTDAAFNLGAGDLSTPVEVPRGFAVLEVEQALEPRAPQLSDVEAQVRQRVEAEKRRQLAEQRLAQAKAELDAGTSLDQVAEELGLSVQESDEFGAGGTVSGLGQAPAVVREALKMDEGQVGGPVSTPQGAVLFQVSSRTRFDPAGFEAAKDATRQRLLQQRAQLLQSSLIDQRRQELGVSYSRQAVERFNLDGGDSAEG
jgi:peptidyl-prolyl cis-trans isomerase D